MSNDVRIKSTGELAILANPHAFGETVPVEIVDSCLGRDDVREVSIEDMQPCECVVGPDRALVMEDFDTLVLQSSVFVDTSGNATIWVVSDAEGVVRLYFQAGFEPKRLVAELTGADAVALGQGLYGFGFEGWQESYRPTGYEIMDGWSWKLTAYAGAKCFSIVGEDANPPELPRLYAFLEGFGVPAVWSDADEAPYYRG